MAEVTIVQLLLEKIAEYNRPDLLWHKQEGVWRKISARESLRRAAALARGLRELGIGKGARVGLVSENRPEWHIVDLACLGMGAVSVPLYPKESAERLTYILKHSGSRLCFVSGAEQFEKVKAAWKDLPELEKVVPFAGSAGAADGGRVVPWERLVREPVADEEVESFQRSAREQQPDDVVTLVYTSGTTGIPKGSLLTQGNFGSNVNTCYGLWGFRPNDLELAVLPLCHIFERTNSYVNLARGARVAYAESVEKVTENMLEVRPTTMAVVPRFFEKFYTRLMEVVQSAPGPKRKLFEWALRVGREALPCRVEGKPMPAGLALRYWVADRLIYRKALAGLGGRLRHFISGGGPLSRDLNEFFHALGLIIYEGYGLTETSPIVAVNKPGGTRIGTVGRPIAGVEVKIAADGEILTRGPHVMEGYYKMEEETREALRDGWFHTGDLGFLDADGFLTITGRKKDVIKTAGGKMIAPQFIESRLKASPYIETAVVLGDRRKFAVALLVPRFANLEQYAEREGISHRSRAELLGDARIQALVQAEVDAVNRELAQYERIKRFALLDREFSFDGGQLTYTQKVRREKIEEEYRSLIERLYQEEASA